MRTWSRKITVCLYSYYIDVLLYYTDLGISILKIFAKYFFNLAQNNLSELPDRKEVSKAERNISSKKVQISVILQFNCHF